MPVPNLVNLEERYSELNYTIDADRKSSKPSAQASPLSAVRCTVNLESIVEQDLLDAVEEIADELDPDAETIATLRASIEEICELPSGHPAITVEVIDTVLAVYGWVRIEEQEDWIRVNPEG